MASRLKLAPLHRGVSEEGLDFLAHRLLDEHKAPELELEPVEVLLRAFFCQVGGPGRALERIEAQVDDTGTSGWFLTPSQPPGWSMNRYL